MQLRFLKEYPLLKVVIPLIFGIWLREYFRLQVELPVLAALVAAFLLWIIFSFRFIQRPVYRLRYISGVLLFVYVLLFGLVWSSLRSVKIYDSGDDVIFKGYIVESLGQTSKSYKYKAVSQILKTGKSVSKEKLNGIIYIQQNNTSGRLGPGDEILLQGRFVPFDKPENPYAFDYSRYLMHERISFRIWAKPEYVRLEAGERINSFSVYISRLHSKLSKFFEKTGITGGNLALLKAFFMGDRSELVRENKQAFADAGVMHLLAVSGLHLGIIYLILVFLFKPLKKGIAKVLFILLLIWGYAFFTGFSSSVFRSAVMFSMVETGTLLKRRNTVYNQLIASMLIIILADPYSVFKAGFWLSHSAVAGIVAFYPLINNVVYFRFILFRWIWSLASVSVAAQLATFPLSIYYFHQFPVFFIFSNVLMVPVLAPVLVLTLVVSLLSVFPVSMSFIKVLSGPLNDLLGYMNETADFIGSVPNAVIKYISFSGSELFLVVLIFLSVAIYINEKWKPAVFTALISVFLLMVSFTVQRVVKYLKPDLVVFSKKNTGICNVLSGDRNIVYLTEKVSGRQLDYVCGGYWSMRRAEVPDVKVLDKDGPEILYFSIREKKILLLHNVDKTAVLKGKIKLDVLILSGKRSVSVQELRKDFDIRMVVLSTGLKYRIRKNTETELKKIKIPYFDVNTCGAWVCCSH